MKIRPENFFRQRRIVTVFSGFVTVFAFLMMASLASPSTDDLLALADAVREAARPEVSVRTDSDDTSGARETGRRGHLRVLRDSLD